MVGPRIESGQQDAGLLDVRAHQLQRHSAAIGNARSVRNIARKAPLALHRILLARTLRSARVGGALFQREAPRDPFG